MKSLNNLEIAFGALSLAEMAEGLQQIVAQFKLANEPGNPGNGNGHNGKHAMAATRVIVRAQA